MAAMAASPYCSAEGYVFAPSDELLVKFLCEKVHYGLNHPGAPIVEYDLYGEEEPWQVWSKFGGGDGFDGRREKDLYFFTKLKKLSPKGCGSHRSRHVGDGGTWSSARSDLLSTGHVVSRDGAPINLHASKTHLRYEKDGSPHHAAWLLAEFSLGHLNNTGSNRFRALDGQFVLCRLRKKYKPAPKAPQVPPLAAAGHYHRPQPKSNNHAAVGSKKPGEGPDRGGQESACNMGSTTLVGAHINQECCSSEAVSMGVDHGISESIGSTGQQEEEEDDDAGTPAYSSTAGFKPMPPTPLSQRGHQ